MKIIAFKFIYYLLQLYNIETKATPILLIVDLVSSSLMSIVVAITFLYLSFYDNHNQQLLSLTTTKHLVGRTTDNFIVETPEQLSAPLIGLAFRCLTTVLSRDLFVYIQYDSLCF